MSVASQPARSVLPLSVPEFSPPGQTHGFLALHGERFRSAELRDNTVGSRPLYGSCSQSPRNTGPVLRPLDDASTRSGPPTTSQIMICNPFRDANSSQHKHPSREDWVPRRRAQLEHSGGRAPPLHTVLQRKVRLQLDSSARRRWRLNHSLLSCKDSRCPALLLVRCSYPKPELVPLRPSTAH